MLLPCQNQIYIFTILHLYDIINIEQRSFLRDGKRGIVLQNTVFSETDFNPYFLGIDGGGTKTVFRLTNENGTIYKELYKGSSNPNDIGMENAIQLLREGITEVCEQIPYEAITLFAGISGGGMTGENASVLKRFFGEFGFYAFDNGSDLENLIALAGENTAVLVIMGTGFIVYVLNGAKRKRIAGWGQFFDEGGSGYTIGKDVIIAALCETDGSGEKTVLSSLLEKRVGESAESHLAEFYRGGKRYIAEFASLAFEAAELGDSVALGILEKNMSFAAQKIRTAMREFTETEQTKIPVFFAGGITKRRGLLFPMIEKHLSDSRAFLTVIKGEPIEGAVKRAFTIFEERQKGNQ